MNWNARLKRNAMRLVVRNDERKRKAESTRKHNVVTDTKRALDLYEDGLITFNDMVFRIRTATK
jgi:hypothetical protein